MQRRRIRQRDRPVTCRDCRKYRRCMERDRMRLCTSFKPQEEDVTAWDMLGALLMVLFSPIMLIVVDIIKNIFIGG